MGNLVDTFIITPKTNWVDKITYVKLYLDDIIIELPNRYKKMMKDIVEGCEYYCSMNTIMDPNSVELDMIHQVLVDNKYSFHKYNHRYRGDCLKQVLRKKFYDTLMIIENDYNSSKNNRFVIVSSHKIISEENWLSRDNSEGKFSKESDKVFESKGYRVYQN